MRNQMVPTVKSEGTFVYLLLLTGFFILLEISFFIQCNQTYLSDFNFVSDALTIPGSILPGIVYFLCAQILVHLSYCSLIWLITSQIVTCFNLKKKQIRLAMGIWSIGILTILVANQYFFPISKFSELTGLLLWNQTVVKISFFFLLTICSIIFIFAFLGLLKNLLISRIYRLLVFVLFLLVFTGSLLFKSPPPITQNIATAERPNIILVGVDSLRPDFLNYFGSELETPFFDRFLKQGTVFAETVTPLARTFPSWSSILTGSYPKNINVRFNLAQQTNLKLQNTLPAILRREGYETIYATDETRFSNLDEKFGFDRIISPPIGLNDFLLGTFNDFPLSNLLVNTVIGKWLFPHSYANRPVYFTYKPDTFLKLMQPALSEQRTKPLFLAAHFCLTHHPYIWADEPAKTALERYKNSVVRVDQELEKFFTLLKQNRLLDHAIVVLLSDHGEALELPGDRITEKELFMPAKREKITVPRFYPPSLDKEDINQSAGHGTDVLGLPQYHTLLAFRMYGMSQQPQVVTGVVSTLDIKPTLLDLLQLAPSATDGQSLASIVQGKTAKPTLRHIFIESDFTPEAIRTVYPETRKVLLEGIQIFSIDPLSTRLLVKDKMGEMIIESKQYADIYGDWMLALYPQNKNFRMPILVNLVTGQWTNNLQSPFAQQSPALIMLEALKTFYGKEIS